MTLVILIITLLLSIKTTNAKEWQANDVAQWSSKTRICPGAASEEQMGYINVGDPASNNTGMDLWFWLFRERDKPPEPSVHKEPPLVLILGGDAGIPATQQVFGPTGPIKLNFGVEGATSMNNWSYSSKADMLYLDHPAPLGLSILRGGSGPNRTVIIEEPTPEENLWMFMQRFMRTFPEYKGRRFGVWAYDLVSHQAISFARYILDQNRRIEEGELDDEPVKLETLGLVSPMIDPMVQISQGLVYAYTNRYTQMINASQYTDITTLLRNSTEYMELCVYGDRKRCLNEQETWFRIWRLIIGLNEVDRKELFDPWNARGRLPKHDSITETLGHEPNLQVDNYIQWSRTLNLIIPPKMRADAEDRYQCREETIIQDLKENNEWMKSSVKNLEFLLDADVRTLIIGGEADLISSWMALRDITNSLNWHGKEKFNKHEFQKFSFLSIENPEEETPPPIGEYQQEDNLAWINIYGQGHDLEKEVPDIMQTLFKMHHRGKLVLPKP